MVFQQWFQKLSDITTSTYVSHRPCQTMRSPTLSIYRSAREYWQFEEPGESSGMQAQRKPVLTMFVLANAATIRRCEGQEDPECSHSIRKRMLLFCAVVLIWFCRIDRNQSGAHSVLWTGYVQHLGNVFYHMFMRDFHLL